MKTHPLKEFLSEAGISQGAFAESIDVSRMTVHRIIHREGEFTTGLIKRVCDATGGKVSPSDFFEASA